MPLRVFLSHASQDSAFAERLAGDLRRAGADIWMDTSHIGPGDFLARFSEALNNRDVLILVLTPAALHSQWVPDEVNAAITRYKQGFMQPPLFVLAHSVSLKDIPALWTNYHRIDATSDYGDALPRILDMLKLPIRDTSKTSPPKKQEPPVVPTPEQQADTMPRPRPPRAPGSAARPMSRRALLITTGAGIATLATAGAVAWFIHSSSSNSPRIGSSHAPTATPSPIPGTPRWRFQTNGKVGTSPAVAKGTVYVGSNDDYLYAIDAATGT